MIHPHSVLLLQACLSCLTSTVNCMPDLSFVDARTNTGIILFSHDERCGLKHKVQLIYVSESDATSVFPPAFRQLFMEGGKDQSTMKKKSILVGPWGGEGGTIWDDGIYNGVREITLVYDRCIDSIQLVYDKNGKPVTAEKHGGSGGSKIAEIKLQYPEEYLISVSGHYSPVVHGGSPVIRSLKFKSNRRTFGPYGVEEGTPFTLSMDGASIVGLMGRGGWYIDALSFRLSCVQSTKLLQKVQKRFQRLTTSVSRTNSIAN